MASYPIISQKALPKAQRTGPGGLGPRRRPAGELPLPGAHEAVVYKSGGSYVVDDGRSRLSDEHIINATNISVIDMREEAPVTVPAQIPSAGAAEFTAQVTFLCTVRRPAEVVEAGLANMDEPLRQYLARHQALFHIGENSELDEISEVRRNVTAEIKAYVSVRPPRFRGIEVQLGSVQVLTPDDLVEFERARRERRREGQLTSEGQLQDHVLAQERQEHQQAMDAARQQYHHELKAQAERNNQALAEMRQQQDEMQELQKRRHEQFVAEMRQAFERERDQRQLEHEQRQRTAVFDHAITEAVKLREVTGAKQSEIPTLLATSAGEQTFAETAESLGSSRSRDREIEAADRLRAAEWGREDDRERWRAEREDSGARWRAEREDAQLRYNIKLKEIEAKLQVFRDGIARGLADGHTIDRVLGVIDGAVRELEEAAPSAPYARPASSTHADPVSESAGVHAADAGADAAVDPETPGETPADDGVHEGRIIPKEESTDTGVREEDFG